MLEKIFTRIEYFFFFLKNKIKGEKTLFYNSFIFLKKGGKIGKNCEIYKNVNFGSEPYLISIGNHVRITNGVKFVTHDGGVWVLRQLYENLNDIDKFGKIKIGNNIHIGLDVIIMPGVEIGDNCVIGCGAVVTKSIPPNSVAVGVPAKVIKSIDEYKNKNESDFVHTKRMTFDDKCKYLAEVYK